MSDLIYEQGHPWAGLKYTHSDGFEVVEGFHQHKPGCVHYASACGTTRWRVGPSTDPAGFDGFCTCGAQEANDDRHGSYAHRITISEGVCAMEVLKNNFEFAKARAIKSDRILRAARKLVGEGGVIGASAMKDLPTFMANVEEAQEALTAAETALATVKAPTGRG